MEEIIYAQASPISIGGKLTASKARAILMNDVTADTCNPNTSGNADALFQDLITGKSLVNAFAAVQNK